MRQRHECRLRTEGKFYHEKCGTAGYLNKRESTSTDRRSQAWAWGWSPPKLIISPQTEFNPAKATNNQSLIARVCACVHECTTNVQWFCALAFTVKTRSDSRNCTLKRKCVTFKKELYYNSCDILQRCPITSAAEVPDLCWPAFARIGLAYSS